MTGLVLAGVFCGVSSAFIFYRTADMSALLPIFRQIHARFLEFRLFFDEPRLIWRAQKALIGANLRVSALLLRPTLILALPVVWLMLQLDAVYGTAPLRVGEPAVVTAQLDTDDEPWVLEAPAGIAVETPPVRITGERQMVWRIRPLRPTTGVLRFTLRGVTLTKAIAAGNRTTFLIRRRERSLPAFLLDPEEPRLPAGSVIWLEVDYPAASRWWMVWFLAISTTSALVFARCILTRS
jgi:hypothetical protein